MEAQGAGLAELLGVIGGRVGQQALLSGDLTGGTFAMGQCVGLINEIKPVKDLIDQIVLEAESIVDKLQTLRDNV